MKEFLPKELQALQMTDSEARALLDFWRDAIRFERWEIGLYGRRQVEGSAYLQWLFEELHRYHQLRPDFWQPIIKAIRKQAKKAGAVEIYRALTDDAPRYIELYLEQARRFGYYDAVKALAEPLPALIFDRLFATPEHIETTLAALQDLGIIDAGNRWSYGNRKAAICAALAVLKRRDWFDSSPPDVELAQCFAAFLGTEIGQSTVYDYAAAPPSYAAAIVTGLTDILPKE